VEEMKRGKITKDDAVPYTLDKTNFSSREEMYRSVRAMIQTRLIITKQSENFALLMDLITRGHKDSKNLIGSGIKAFSVKRNKNNIWSFFCEKEDGTQQDFSFLECFERIWPRKNEKERLKPFITIFDNVERNKD
jgi:hypothetical protein